MLKNNKMFRVLSVIFMTICVLVSAVPMEVRAWDVQEKLPIEEPQTEKPQVEEPQVGEPPIVSLPMYTIVCKNLPDEVFSWNIYDMTATLEEEWIESMPPEFEYEVIKGQEFVTCFNEGEQTKLKIDGIGDFAIRITLKNAGEHHQSEPLEIQKTAKEGVRPAILSFKIGEREGTIKDEKIELKVPYGTDITKLAPTIEITENCVVSPATGEEKDFTQPVEYVVTNASGYSAKYLVNVIVEACAHEEYNEATCTTPRTCKICGKTEGEPLGHDWKEATCTEPKRCARCEITEGKPLGHDWKEATCTEPKRCVRCQMTEGEALGHAWDKWIVTKKPTTTEGGQEERRCTRCKVTESREVPRMNLIGKAENNTVKGIKDGGIYEVNEVIAISAYGDGMNIKEPIADDVRYVPAGWKVTDYTKWEKSPYEASFKIKDAGEYRLQVYFQKQVFDGKSWINQKEMDVKNLDFTVVTEKILPVKTGDDTPIGALVGILVSSVVVIGAIVVIKLKRK